MSKRAKFIRGTLFFRSPKKSNYPSDNIFELQEWTRRCFDKIFRAGKSYKKVAVNLLGLIPNEGLTARLYDTDPNKEKLDRLNRAIQEINRKFGRHTVHLATARKEAWQTRRRRDRYLYAD